MTTTVMILATAGRTKSIEVKQTQQSRCLLGRTIEVMLKVTLTRNM